MCGIDHTVAQMHMPPSHTLVYRASAHRTEQGHTPELLVLCTYSFLLRSVFFIFFIYLFIYF